MQSLDLYARLPKGSEDKKDAFRFLTSYTDLRRLLFSPENRDGYLQACTDPLTHEELEFLSLREGHQTSVHHIFHAYINRVPRADNILLTLLTRI